MKILFTNHHLADFAGTETFTWTVAHALRRAGHEVTLITAQKGAAARIFEDEGFEVFDEFEGLKDRRFDVIHAQHNPMAVLARHAFPEVPMVFMGHGVFHPLEQPPSLDLAVAEWVAVSEEIRGIWAERYELQDVIVFRNPIDCRRFRPLKPIGKRLERVLVISNNYPVDLRAMVKRTCEERGIKVGFVGGIYHTEWEIERLINEADLVISIGRGVLEAMACGRAALVLDRHGCDGLMTPEVYYESRKFNLSGRRFARKPNQKELTGMLAAYDCGMGEVNRALIEEHHDVDQTVSVLEGIYERAVKTTLRVETSGLPVNEIAGCIDRWRSSLRNAHVLLDYERDKLKNQPPPAEPGEYERAYWIVVKDLARSLEPERLLAKAGLKTLPLESLLEGAGLSSAAMVSGGPSAHRHPLRGKVEGCDLVCRVNKFVTPELEHCTGRRCDLWVVNGYALAGLNLKEHLPLVLRILFTGDLRPVLAVENVVSLRRMIGRRPCAVWPSDELDELTAGLGGYPPTNGYLALRVLLEAGVRRFLILGSDYFLEPPFDALEEKDVPLEVGLIAEACRASGCVIECPSPLHDLLRLAGVPLEKLQKV
jgi:hypothetical protein